MKEWYVQKVDGMPASRASSRIAENGISSLYGTIDMTPDTIIARTYPDYYHTLYKTGVVVLYPEGVSEDEMLTTRVPNLIGMSAIECIEALRKMNLNCKITSDSDIEGLCTMQSVTSGSTVYAGEIIKVTLTNTGAVSQPTPTPTPTPAPGAEDGVADALPPEHHDEDDT